MPGMMDTILNLGLNDEAVAGLAKTTGNERFARDSYRRLIQMYGEVVDGVEGHRFEQALTDLKSPAAPSRTSSSPRTTSPSWSRPSSGSTPTRPARRSRRMRARSSRSRPRRLRLVESPRAQVYRRTYEIPDDLGTAVNVVQMVFGNKGDSSGTGVCFTRRPPARAASTASSSRTRRARTSSPGSGRPSRSTDGRAPARGLCAAARDDRPARGPLPRHAGHRVHGRGGNALLLQTRTAKRAAAAALRAAVEMVAEG